MVTLGLETNALAVSESRIDGRVFRVIIPREGVRFQSLFEYCLN